jgi:hypothetical protein
MALESASAIPNWSAHGFVTSCRMSSSCLERDSSRHWGIRKKEHCLIVSVTLLYCLHSLRK